MNRRTMLKAVAALAATPFVPVAAAKPCRAGFIMTVPRTMTIHYCVLGVGPRVWRTATYSPTGRVLTIENDSDIPMNAGECRSIMVKSYEPTTVRINILED